MEISQLKQGDVLYNQDLMKTFGCSGQGGMRRGTKTNSLVLISNHVKSIYDDRWVDNIFHYTGMGTKGNQSLEFAQNKTLNESNENGINVFLFEVFEEKKYIYIGQVELAGLPYKEKQLDDKKNERDAYIFPLRLKNNGQVFAISEEILNENNSLKEKKARKLSDVELLARIKNRRNSGTRKTAGVTYERNPYVVEYTKRRARGICELCNKPAPFKNNLGEPYLEVHHIEWLSQGGEDTAENTAALCPNCHRKIHVLNSNEDREKLINKIKYIEEISVKEIEEENIPVT